MPEDLSRGKNDLVRLMCYYGEWLKIITSSKYTIEKVHFTVDFITSMNIWMVPGEFLKPCGIQMNRYRQLWDEKYFMDLYFTSI